jgi:hypothetical protein
MVCTAALCSLACTAFLTPALAADKSPFGGTVRDEVGVNIHFNDPLPGEMKMLSQAGFGSIRMDILWSSIEKTKGVYDFSHSDTLIKNLEKYHIRPLLILDYTNPLYFNNGHPDDAAWRADFDRWAVATVTHFRVHHIIWEMWNEPNYANGDWYIHLALATGQALHAADPGETYIGPAEGGTDPGFLEHCFQAGMLNYWQAVSIHPYRTSNPETMDYGPLKALVAKYEPAGKNIPILSGEWGYSVIPAGKTYSFVTSDAEQASYFDREMLWNLMNGIPLSIWYDWRNDSEKPGDTESNFGLVHNPPQAGQANAFQPKPSYVAALFFLHTLGDYRFDQSLKIPDITDGYLTSFTKRHDHRYTAWTTSPTPEQATLPIPPGKYTLYDLMGQNAKQVIVDHSGMPLTLTGDVQFIVAR